MAYSKLHSSIVNSSLWIEPDATRLLFITLLAMCDKDGMVYGSRNGLARAANIDPDSVEEAWHSLMSPDPDSSDKHRAPENEGRRVEEVSGGFRLLNFAYYRGLRNEDDRREQNRTAQEKFRASAKVSQGKPASAAVSRVKPPKAHTETDTETETEAKKEKTRKRVPAAQAVTIETLCMDGLPEDLANEWLAHRARKRAVLTPRAWGDVKAAIAKAGWSVEEAIAKALGRGWTGIEAHWLRDEAKDGGEPQWRKEQKAAVAAYGGSPRTTGEIIDMEAVNATRKTLG